MSRGSVATGTVLTVMLLATACSGSEQNQHSDQIAGLASEAPAAAGPLESLTWDLPFGEPASVDPVLSYDQAASPVTSNMCESLLTYDTAGQLRPNLAAAWQQPDASTVVLTLRTDVTFWNRKPMTADDVVYSLNRNVNPEVGSFWAAPWFTNVASIAVTGTSEVTIKLTEPDSVFVQILATNAGQISERAYVEAKADRYGTATGGLMCTGPLMFDSWKPGESITLRKNPDYWNEGHEAHAEAVTFSFVTDPSTLTNALETGEIDGSFYVPVSAVDKLSESEAGTLYGAESLQFDYMMFSAKQGPALDPDVRKAISLALDRQAIADSIYKSTATPAWTFTNVNGETPESVSEGVPGHAVDLDEAKSLVDNADVDTSATIDLATPSENPVAVAIATYAQSTLAQIGLTVRVKKLPFSEFIAATVGGPEAAAAYDAYVFGGYLDVPNPVEFFIACSLPDGVLNLLQQDDPELIELINEARATIDSDEQASLTTQILARAGEVNQSLVLARPKMLTFMGKDITGAPLESYSVLSTPWAAAVGAK